VGQGGLLLLDDEAGFELDLPLILEVVNGTDRDIEMISEPLIGLEAVQGGVFAVVEQPERLWEANSSFALSLTVPRDLGTSVARMTLAWGPTELERFWVQIRQTLEEPPVDTGDSDTGGSDTGVELGEGLFVAAGMNGVIAVSEDDGLSWSTSEHGDPDTSLFRRPNQEVYTWSEVVYTGRRFVLFGREAQSTGSRTLAWESRDGYDWQAVPLTGVDNVQPSSGVALYGGAEVFLSGGAAYMSSPEEPDIVLSHTFFERASEGTLTDLATDGTQVLAVAKTGLLYQSQDGIDWTESSMAAGTEELFNLVAGQDRFVAVGTNHSALVSVDGGTSWEWSTKERDGQDKFNGKCARPDTWCEIRWGGEQFVVYERGRSDVGPAMRWTSPDGMSWTGQETTDTIRYWDLNPESGVVVAVELTGKTVDEGEIPPFFRADDGLAFEGINGELTGSPELMDVAFGWAVVQ